MGFEQLTQQPRETMQSLCQYLQVDFCEDLIQPYANQEQKMVDGLHLASTPMGDVNFRQHERIDPQVADHWKAVEQDDFLGEVTWELAQQFGYQRAESDEHERWSQQKQAAQSRKQLQRQRRAKRTRTRTENPE
jgi:hypothetical protein